MTPGKSPTEKPVIVRRAVQLLYLRIAVGIVMLFWEWSVMKDSLLRDTDPLIVFFVAMIGLLFLALLTWKIDGGYGWARIVYLIFFLLGFPIWVRGMVRLFSYSIILDGLSITAQALELVGIVMLFSRDASIWFRSAAADSPATSNSSESDA